MIPFLVTAILSTPVAFATGVSISDTKKTVWLFGTEYTGELSVRRGTARAIEGATISEWPTLDQPTIDRAWEQAGGAPDAVVHSFSSAEENAVLAELRDRSGGRTKLILVGKDGGRPELFDLLIRAHHHAPVDPALSNRVLRVEGLPTSVRREDLESLKSNRYADLPGPRVLALVGGRTAHIDFGPDAARRFGRVLASVRGGTLMVTNSRRTPRLSFAAFLESADPNVIVDARFGDENPYHELLAAADHIVVTGDSSAMISDALETGKPVHLYAPREIMEEQHVRFNLPLVQSGRVRLLRDPLETWTSSKNSTSARIARRCAELFEI